MAALKRKTRVPRHHAFGLLLVIPLLLGFQNCSQPFQTSLPSKSGSTGELTDRQVSLELAWDPSPSAEAVGYKIYYGENPANLNQSVTVGDVTTARIDGLQADKKYYFSAVALDAESKESERTAVVEFSN